MPLRRLARAGFGAVARPAYLRLRAAGAAVVDRRLGVVTGDEVVAGRLGAELGHFRRTQRALTWNGALRLLRRLDLGPGDVLLDLGCGAGRVACLAARRPLGRVIGVELDGAMVEIAARNARALRGRRCPLEIVNVDATRFEVPDDVTCVYMYNPFAGEVLDAVLRQILRSADRRPRRLRIAYANPKEHERLLATGRIRHAGRMSLGWRPGSEWVRTQTVHLYEVEPARPGDGDAGARDDGTYGTERSRMPKE